MPDIIVEENGDVVVIILSGEITMLTVKDIDHVCKKYLNSNLKVLALDLRSVQFIDSYGISRIIKILRAFTIAGAEFVLINMNDNIRLVFKIATFDKMFTIMTKEEFSNTYLRS